MTQRWVTLILVQNFDPFHDEIFIIKAKKDSSPLNFFPFYEFERVNFKTTQPGWKWRIWGRKRSDNCVEVTCRNERCFEGRALEGYFYKSNEILLFHIQLNQDDFGSIRLEIRSSGRLLSTSSFHHKKYVSICAFPKFPV